MSTIASTRQHFLSQFDDRTRMLAIRFGSRRPELRPPLRSFLVQRADITERLSTPVRAVIQGITPDVWPYPHDKVPGDKDVAPHPDRFLGMPAGLIVRSQSHVRTFHGMVTGVRHLGHWHSQTEDEGYHAVELTIESPLRLFDLRRANRLYQERTTLQILHELLDEHRFCNEVVEETLRAAFPDQRDHGHLARACRTQYQETDLEFIHRLLIDEGLTYVLRSEKGESGTGNLWEVFGADHDFGSDLYATLSTRPRPGEFALLGWHAQRRLVPAYTQAVSHDYRANAHFEGRGEGRQNEDMGRYARGEFGHYETLPPRAVIDPSTQMGTPAQYRQWAHDLDAEMFEGESAIPLALVKPIRVRGLDSVRVPLCNDDDKYLVTSQRIVANAIVDQELRQRLDPLANDVRRRSGIELFESTDQPEKPPLTVTFAAQPVGKPLVSTHPAHARRPVPGPMTATVAGPEGAVVETDELGRIAVNFHWERRPDVPEFKNNFPQFDSAPVRIRYVHPGAGAGMGMQCLPRVGDEVLVLFIDNDPDRPIAVGSVHNGDMATPSFGGVSSLPKDAALTGLRTSEHKGGGANEMVFDDTTGEVGLRLGSTTAATDLSLGCITTRRKDGAATLRGAGAELRTDGSITLRAAQGMLLTTHAVEGEASHLEHAALSELLASCKCLLDDLEAKLRRRLTMEDAADGRDRLSQSLASWTTFKQNSTLAPTLALTSPDTIVTAAKASQLHFAGAQMDLVAADRLQFHSGSLTSIAAEKGVAIHAAANGIAIEALAGPITVGAHRDQMALTAQKDILLTAHEGKIRIHAPIVELVSVGGSYIRIGENIEIGSPEALLVKTSGAHFMGKASMDIPMKANDPKHADSKPALIYAQAPHDEPHSLGVNGTEGAGS